MTAFTSKSSNGGLEQPEHHESWQDSPIYLALSERISHTESTLASLTAQVASLSATVSALSASAGLALSHTSLDTGDGAGPSSDGSPSVQGNASDISALMQQVAALSMSVTQLQKIQTSQAQLTRSNSGSAPTMSGFTAARKNSGGTLPMSDGGLAVGAPPPGVTDTKANGTGGKSSATGSDKAPGKLTGLEDTTGDQEDTSTPTPNAGTIGNAPSSKGSGASGPSLSANGPGSVSRPGAQIPLTLHNTNANANSTVPGLTGMLSPPLSSINKRQDFARPNLGRSLSANPNVLNSPSQLDGDKWHPHAHAHPHGPVSPRAPGPAPGMSNRMGPGHLPMPSLSLGGMGVMNDRVWSPGGIMTPRVEITQSQAVPQNPGGTMQGQGQGQGQGGAATPGAGIVVTKWDHLNLKVELLRGISKYGIGPPNKIQARVLPFMLKGSDIIAQAPPTQERIISYVIPSLQTCLSNPPSGPYRGPTVIIVTTTVDQATQCHKLVRNIGGPLGIRAALVTGVTGTASVQNEIAAIQRDAVHLLIGTPAKLNEVMTARGAMGGSECRLLVLDEVDQLIARNLYENVLSIAKLLPPPRRGPAVTPGGANTSSPAIGQVTSPYDAGQSSPFNPNSKTPFPGQAGSRFSGAIGNASPIERQTCLFSNTIPTDVITFSQTLNVRDPVRVLVRRDGGPNSQESVSSVTPGINLKHTYVYLTITGSAAARAEAAAAVDGPGAIGSGRSIVQQSAAQGQGQGPNEEATRAKEYKLDMLVKLLEDYPMWQAIVHVGTYSMLEAVVYKLQSRQWETTYLTPDMPPAQRKAVISQWRSSSPHAGGPRFMVTFDVNVKPPEISWVPLIVNFDLPRSVEGYAARAAAGVPPQGRNGLQVYQVQSIPGAAKGSNQPGQGQGPPQQQQQQQQVFGVVVSFVQAAGGDVEMLRSTECAYRFKSAEIPSVFHDLF